MWFTVVSFAILLAAGSCQKDPHYIGDRTTMVHLFEWKFSDVADECEEFLGPKGFAAVQISPIHENLILDDRPWFERYQPLSYKLESRSGNEAEFRDMIKRCNDANVRVFVDVVINHMAADKKPAIGTAGSIADTEHRSFPAVPYDIDDFNPPCEINNYNDAENVRNCELEGLHDLNQTQEHVRERIVDLLNRILDAGAAGFRVDAAKHMWPEDLAVIYERMNNLNTEHGYPSNTRPFIYQEVIDLGHERVSKMEYIHLAPVIEFLYGIIIGYMFRGLDNLSRLSTFENAEAWYMPPTQDAVVMVDNHDNQRAHGAGGKAILTFNDPRPYKMATAFMLSHPYGWARVMSSYRFDDPSQGPPADVEGNIISRGIADDGSCTNGWVCEHRWPEIYRMVAFRNLVNKEKLTNWWSDGSNQIAFSRGDKGFVAFAVDEDLREILQTGLPEGTYCDVISGDLVDGACSGKMIRVGPDGTAFVEILQSDPDGVVALHVKAKL